MTSVSIQVDECGRLWVIDSGVTNVLHTADRMCPPKLMVFDLYTDTLTMKYVFPKNVLESSSLLVTVAVDNRARHCGDSFAYVADVTQFGLIVFDSKSRHSWRVTSNYFYPYPTHGSFNIAGSEFDLMDGIIGLALSPVDKYGLASLSYCALICKESDYIVFFCIFSGTEHFISTVWLVSENPKC